MSELIWEEQSDKDRASWVRDQASIYRSRVSAARIAMMADQHRAYGRVIYQPPVGIADPAKRREVTP